jgi:hypothetical protein
MSQHSTPRARWSPRTQDCASRLTRRLPVALALGLVALSGCGSSSHVQNDARRQAAAGRAQALAHRREQVVVEVSDMTAYSTCAEWLHASVTARDAYLLKNWPHLHPKQVKLIVREQSLGCEAEPHGHSRTAMDPLQAAVYLVLLNFEDFYEETLAAGVKEGVDHFDARAMGLKIHRLPEPSTRRHAG